MRPRTWLRVYAYLGLSLASACTIRIPDGQLACKVVADCPPGFHACRATEQSDAGKYCFRAGESTSSEAGRAGSGGGGSGGSAGEHKPEPAGHGGADALGRSDIDAGDQPGAAEGGAPPATDHAGRGGAGAGGSAGKVAPRAGTGGAPGPTEFNLLHSEPEDGATLDDPNGAIVAYFSQPLDEGSVTSQTLRVTLDGGGSISGKLTVEVDKLTFQPNARWTLSTQYTVELTSSIFSKSQLPLPSAKLKFQVRAGKWARERVETSVEGRGFQLPTIAASPSGQVALTWKSAYVNSRHAGVVAKRLNADGSWTTLADGSGTAANPGILVLDDGTVVYGANPEDSGDWSLTCVDAMGSSHELVKPAGGQPSGEYIQHMTTDGSNVILLQSTGSSSYKVITSSCTFPSPSVWNVPIAADASSVQDVLFTRPGVAVWAQATSSMALDGGTLPTGIFGVDNGGAPDCAKDASACPLPLSAAGNIADSPALISVAFDEILLWRQQDAPNSAIWSRIHDADWSTPLRISDPSQTAHSPILSTSRGQTTALALWIEDRVVDGIQLVGAALKDKTWAKASPLSAAFPASNWTDISAVATNPIGNGMALWAQATSASDTFNYRQYDVHALPYTARDGFRTGDDFVLSLSHLAQPEVSLTMIPDGRAFAAWVESDAVWYGHYD